MKVSDTKAFELLTKHGIQVAEYIVVKNIKDLYKFSEKHFPFVLKVDAPEIIHKRKLGCVKVVTKELEDVYKTITKIARKYARNFNIIAQEFLFGDEFFVGAKRDEQFGIAILFGIGGSFVEIINKISVRIAPLSSSDIDEMFEEIGCDVDKNIKNIIFKVQGIMKKYNDIKEIDINPLIVGEDIKVVDVRVITSEPLKWLKWK